MQAGPTLWFIVLAVGAIVLVLEMGYGITRSRTRIPAEKQQTDEATRRSKS
ncbi:hypothetical protein [Devosia sp. A369]